MLLFLFVVEDPSSIWNVLLPVGLCWFWFVGACEFLLPFARGRFPTGDETEALTGPLGPYFVVVAGTTAAVFVLSYAAAHRAMSLLSPDSYSEHVSVSDAVYFSLSTFTTTGYGDIAPRSGDARLLTASQMLGSMFFGLLVLSVVANFLTTKSEQ